MIKEKTNKNVATKSLVLSNLLYDAIWVKFFLTFPGETVFLEIWIHVSCLQINIVFITSNSQQTKQASDWFDVTIGTYDRIEVYNLHAISVTAMGFEPTIT